VTTGADVVGFAAEFKHRLRWGRLIERKRVVQAGFIALGADWRSGEPDRRWRNKMHRSIRMTVAALLLVVPAAAAFAAEKEEPFKYRNLPVEASCLDGYHPTVDASGNNVFPCIANAEITTTPGTGGPVLKATAAAKP